MPYELFCQSVQGAGHIKKGMPCEDYGMKFGNDICNVFVLGDGHGDSNCPRSSFGSRTLCEIAVEELSRFAQNIEEQGWTELLLTDRSAKQLVNQLVMSIFGKWSCAVNDDFIANPLTEEEEIAAKDYIDRYRRGERIEHIYGTTFIAGLQTKEYLLLLQQGDGRCVVFNSEGEASQPIPWDDRCFSNVTTSVCDTDAVQSCRYYIVDLSKDPVIACVAGSDGVEDSFGSMDKMHAYYRGKLAIACESGVEALEEHWAETLPAFSEAGSQDDTTICGIIDREAFRGKLDKMQTDNETIIIKDEIRKAQERIVSMTPKLEYLRKKFEDGKAKHALLEKSLDDLKAEYDSIKRDIAEFDQQSSGGFFGRQIRRLSQPSVNCLKRRMEAIKKERDTRQAEIAASADALKALYQEYVEYKSKYEGFIALKAENEAKLNRLLAPKPADDTHTEVQTITPADDADVFETPVEETETPVEEIETPVEEIETPVEETETPVEETETPVEETETPVEEIETPVEETETPVEETETPVEETETPVEETETPVEETEPSVEETETPVEETEAPVEETETPVEETEAPVEETETPVEETETPVEETEAPGDEWGEDDADDTVTVCEITRTEVVVVTSETVVRIETEVIASDEDPWGDFPER